jgi:hypothetical protein
MASITVGYSVDDDGWKSFFSYHPDTGCYLNNSMYTFKNGELYKHDTNPIRNAFYWNYSTQQYYTYPSTVTVVMNDDPLGVKDFRTIAIDGNAPWGTTITTDLASGLIQSDYYVLKEGKYYSYIRRNPGTIDPKATSTQGVGVMSSYNVGTQTMSFPFLIDQSISQGDKVYKVDGNNLVLIGVIGSVVNKTIVLSSVSVTPVSGQMMVIVKDSTAESYGARGYYMEVQLQNSNTTEVELFAISSEFSRSMP